MSVTRPCNLLLHMQQMVAHTSKLPPKDIT